MDLALQIGVAVDCLAKLRMLEFYYYFLRDILIELLGMDTNSVFFAFSEEYIDKLFNLK
jgi:hypothetical protein